MLAHTSHQNLPHLKKPSENTLHDYPVGNRAGVQKNPQNRHRNSIQTDILTQSDTPVLSSRYRIGTHRQDRLEHTVQYFELFFRCALLALKGTK